MKTSVNLEFFVNDALRAVERGDVIIVIDVLRCCSTIITALANGAKGIMPAKTLKEARALHNKHPEFILAGERRGMRPKEFDLGNSPLEFTSKKVKGKQVILTTTNGTEGIIMSKKTRWALIGALLNAKTVAKTALKIARKEQVGISLVLSGKSRHFFMEDFICAGAVAEAFQADNTHVHECSDPVLAALFCFRQVRDCLDDVIQSGHHAVYLKSLGFGSDVKFCSQLNVSETVPFLRDNIIILLTGIAVT